MNAEALPVEPLVLRMARELGRRRFRVVRVHPNGKNPTDKGWPTTATAEVTLLEQQFSAGEFNIGVACGPQPNEINLVAIDIDPPGIEIWDALVAEHGGLPRTATHLTPRGGRHIFFNAPVDIRNSASQIAPGVDVRGDGGQVVVPPSWRTVDGEKRFYTDVEGSGLWRRTSVVADMPEWLVELCRKRNRPAEVQRSVERHPSQTPTDPSEWLRDHWDWVGILESQGHTIVRSSGEHVYFRHPTATSDHSAVVHLRSNMMVSWSTNFPQHPRGRANADGSVPWSPFDWFVATEHGYDNSAAVAEIRRRMGVGGGVDHRSDGLAVADYGPVGGQREGAVSLTVPELYLPTEFWSATPLLWRVYEESLKRQRTPDAVLSALLSMYATTIPMGIWLPEIVGAPAPLNLYGILAGISGAGKTAAMSIAANLMGDPGNQDIRMRQSLRSGEGLISKVLKKRKKDDEETAPTHYVGVHVHYDEGGAMSKQANQTASTIMPYLNTAWSGAGTVGGARADSDLGFDASKVRICATIGVQFGIGANIFTGEAATLGFPQRLLWLMADKHPAIQDQQMPDEPVRVQPLGLPFLPQHEYVRRPVTLSIPRPIRQEVWDWAKTTPDQYDSHMMNLRLRVAAVLMFMHGAGDDVFDFFWGLSSQILACHHDVRHTFVQSIQSLLTKRNQGLGLADAQRQEAAHEYTLDRAVQSLMTKLAGGQTFAMRALKDHFKSWTKRYGITHHDVLDRALLLGLVILVEGGVRKA